MKTRKTAARKSGKKRAVINASKIIISIIALVAIAAVVLVFTDHKAMADPSVTYHKCYKTVEVRYGDSLWSLASEYKAGSDMTTAEFVEEIKFTNSLSSDGITAGNYLLMPYYVAD